jgi:hypothetical protein
MSEVKVNKISPRTNCGTVTLGDSGDAFTIPSGVTITNNGTQVGFGRTGTVDWQTGDIKTAEFTAVTGKGYFVNTTSGGVTVNLPAGSAGDIVGLKDYAATWDSNAITLAPNGSEKIGGDNANDPTVGNEGGSLLLVYVDSTQGWLTTQQSVTASPSGAETFMVATGGTPCAGATSGDYKYHTFTGPGTFTVCSVGSSAANNVVDYLVVAAGGGGGVSAASGGGAGGFRLSNDTCMSAPQTSPLAHTTGITVTATGYPIAIGAGGAGSTPPGPAGGTGGTSSFSCITSAGGGGGTPGSGVGIAGGSGSGGHGSPSPSPPGYAGGAGNTPPVSPPQGQPGGAGADGLVAFTASGGGGGAGAAGGDAGWCAPGRYGGPGGAGSYVVQTGFGACNGTTGPVPGARYFAGGGGGSINDSTPGAGGTAGVGGGGTGGSPPNNPASTCSTAGGTNTGGGGGGDGPGTPTGKSGGSGIVILRYKFQ